MNSTWYFSVLIVLGICATLQCSISQESSVENSGRIVKRAGGVRLTKFALRQLARSLRRSGSLARRAVNRLEYWSGGRISAQQIIDVIDGVADRLSGAQTATCEFFTDVGVTLGIPRNIGYAICNVVIDLLL